MSKSDRKIECGVIVGTDLIEVRVDDTTVLLASDEAEALSDMLVSVVEATRAAGP
jgi:transcriptional antiterminator Rof (Rho-off)